MSTIATTHMPNEAMAALEELRRLKAWLTLLYSTATTETYRLHQPLTVRVAGGGRVTIRGVVRRHDPNDPWWSELRDEEAA